jgi:Cu(I)/Ag(I) efflux system membrane fusion protein
MQLAGKPSLIDPAKAVPRFRNTPLEFESIQVARIEGPTGQQIENLYQAYFEIQRALASDKLPGAEPVVALEQLAKQLLASEQVPEGMHESLETIQRQIPHLHHLPIDEARIKFKPVSHAVLVLSTRVRGARAERPFYHFFCPMVKQGEGDWLQADDLLRNPYWGSEMLRCGELVGTTPPNANPDAPEEEKAEQDVRRGTDPRQGDER